jgi:hypothetical protein
VKRNISFFILAALLGNGSLFGASTTWHYTSTTLFAFQDDTGGQWPAGQKVSIDVTFDPLTPDSTPFDGTGDYLMSGGDTRLQVNVAGHLSTPVTQFRITAIASNCCTHDQYNFLSYESEGFHFPIDFPGFYEGATMIFFFESRLYPGPITSDALPTDQPDPGAFKREGFGINKPNRIAISGSVDAIPEPTSAALIAFAAMIFGTLRSRKRSI